MSKTITIDVTLTGYYSVGVELNEEQAKQYEAGELTTSDFEEIIIEEHTDELQYEQRYDYSLDINSVEDEDGKDYKGEL